MLGSFKTIWDFAGTEQGNIKKSIIVGFIYSLFYALVIVALYLVFAALVEGRMNPSVALLVLGIMLISVIGRIVTQYFSQLQRTHASYFMIANERIRIGERLMKMPMGYFNDNSLGRITALETTTLDDVENMVPIVLVNMLGGFLDTIVFVIAMMFFNWQIGLLAVVGFLLFLLVTTLMEKKANAAVPSRQQAQANLVETLLEYVQGMGVVKAFNLHRDSEAKVQEAIENSYKKNMAVEVGVTPLIALQQIVLDLISVTMMILALWQFCFQGLPLANCLVCIILSFMIFGQLKSAGSSLAGLRIVDASLKQVRSLDDAPILKEGNVVNVPETFDITFKDVEFSYERQRVIDDVTVEMPDRAMTAIVGPSGSGKTTMCNLISRFWDVDGGSVSIGGIDVRNYRIDSLMNMMTAVFQDVYLFNDTIENNIRFGNSDALYDEVVEAAKKACCDDFIEELPEGYQTIIGEGGAKLSGGQRQRISIARALLKDAPIVLLDEATANVDPENENKLQIAIEALTQQKTVVMIAHRLKTVRNADQILVLDRGRIVQRGTPEQLAREPGIYANFIDNRRHALKWGIGTEC